MKEINNSDIGLIIGFYDDKNILQIASIYEVMDDYIVTDLNERVAKKDIVDVGFVDLNKHDQLQARIKELESEKELAYQQGKNDAVDILLENFSPDGDLSMLTKTVRYGEEYVEAWDVEKLNDFFKINQSITGVHQEFSEMVECLYWNAVAIKEGYTDELYSPNSPSETEIKLKEFIDYKINEIKAQGIEELLKSTVTNELYGFEAMGSTGRDIIILEMKQRIRELRRTKNQIAEPNSTTKLTPEQAQHYEKRIRTNHD